MTGSSTTCRRVDVDKFTEIDVAIAPVADAIASNETDSVTIISNVQGAQMTLAQDLREADAIPP